MTEARFDPGGFYEFNLAHGAVRTRDGARVLVLSDNVVAPLVSAAVKAGDLTAVRRLGRQLGELVKGSIGSTPNEQAPEVVLGHATAILALFGWGRLNLTRWGDALVASVAQVPELDDDHLGVAALLGGLFSELGGHDVACVPTDAGDFVLVNPDVAARVWAWSREGDDVAAIVGKLGGAS